MERHGLAEIVRVQFEEIAEDRRLLTHDRFEHDDANHAGITDGH